MVRPPKRTADGFSVDMSLGGIQSEIAGIDRLPTKQILVGVEAHDSVLHFASVETRRVELTENGLRIGAAFTQADRDLIRRENIEPTFNPRTCRFGMDLPLEVIAKWIEFGILRHVDGPCVDLSAMSGGADVSQWLPHLRISSLAQPPADPSLCVCPYWVCQRF